MNTHPNTEVIIVHGLWYGAWAMSRLGKILIESGFSIRLFSYPAIRDDLEHHARQLHQFAKEHDVEQQHFLGHSLGGLVILRMLAEFDDIASGRVLLLGSPLGGSAIARRMRKIPGSNRLLGQVQTALEQGYTRMPEGRETGMIAGSRAIGLGLLTGGVGGPSDGTVGLHETEATGLAARLVLPVTHSGMIYSKEVAQKSALFLKTGRFAEPL